MVGVLGFGFGYLGVGFFFVFLGVFRGFLFFEMLSFSFRGLG